MRWTRLSFTYLIGYLSLGGLGLLVAPDLALRLLGAFMVALALLVGQIVRYRVELLYPTTLLVRVVLLGTIVGLYFESRDPLFWVLSGIVALGMLLTTAGLLTDRRASARTGVLGERS
jgi:hypothetical protein